MAWRGVAWRVSVFLLLWAGPHLANANSPDGVRELVSPDGLVVALRERAVTVDDAGRVVAVRDGSDVGLGSMPESDVGEATVELVRDNAHLWNPSSVAGDLGDALHEVDRIERTLEDGRTHTVVYFDQEIEGVPVLDGRSAAVFLDGRLIRVSGRVFSSETYAAPPIPEFDPVDATAIAEGAVLDQGMVVVSSVVSGGGYSLESERLLYVVETIAESAETGDYPDRMRVLVDAVDGEVIDVTSSSSPFGSTPATYRVFSPDPGDALDNVQHIVDLAGGHAAVNAAGTQYYPWRDELPSRTPTPVYNDAVTWTGGSCAGGSPCMGFHWNAVNGTYAFLSAPGGDSFRMNHLSYWTQRAVNQADLDMAVFPPLGGYRFAKITTVLNHAGVGARTSWDGCSFPSLGAPPVRTDYTNTWRPADGAVGAAPKNVCILMQAPPVEYGGLAPRISTVFHEVGHALDIKYLQGLPRNMGFGPNQICELGTTEESASLSEGVAAAFSALMYLTVFGDAATFNDATAAGNLDRHQGLPVFSGHTDDGNLLCHSPSGASCTAKYSFDRAFVQAVWEIAKGLNCDGPVGEACYIIPDAARADAARMALMYAMATSPRQTSFHEFVENLLEFYNIYWGYAAWNSRWWVFDHHGLSYQNYPYHPCWNDQRKGIDHDATT